MKPLGLSAFLAFDTLAARFAAQAQDTHFFINNMTDITVVHVYVFPPNKASGATLSSATRS